MADSMGDIPTDPAKLNIVIALFEREYPEERIKKAILHCNSVESAIEWLEREGGGSAPRTPMENAVSASAPTRAAAKNNRRRVNSKSAEAANAPVTTRPTLLEKEVEKEVEKEEQPLVPQSDSKASSRASPITSEGLNETVSVPHSRSPPDTIVASVAVEPEPQAVCAVNLEECEAEVIISSEEVPLIEIRPLEPDVAADFWAKARARWPQIRQDLLDQATGGQKRPAPATSDTADATSTPTKKSRTSFESPTATPSARPPATPQGSGGSASASAVNVGGDEAAGSSEEASVTKAHSPSSASHARVGQFASRSAAILRSPPPAGQVSSSRRGSWTPGTSPRAQMSHNPSPEMCEICCNDIAKGAAVRLGCRHGWYCQNCMVKHAEARLEVGAAHVACPECSAPIAECNLRKMLPPEIIDRLLARSLEQAVSSTADLWACPTPNCPMRVALEDGEEPRLLCTECKKESCLRCQSQPYHKGLTCEEHAERMRQRKNKKAQLRDDESFRQWMQETGTKQCPTCGMAVTKQNLQSQATQYQECHKMLCRNCNTKFCFKCRAILTESFTCGCSIDRHGFVDPRTGKRLDHLRPPKVGRPAGKPAAKPRGR